MIDKMKEIVALLNRARDTYYNNSQSIMSDYDYDKMFDELVRLEQSTGTVLSASPTRSVGFEVKSKLEKAVHNHPMLSLDKTKSVEELKKFIGIMSALLMLKLDGLTISLKYSDGKLVSAETRGNGEIGENVLHTVRAFINVPLTIDYKEELVVDGEAIIDYATFDAINQNLNDKYKNPRNLVSGSVRQLDSKITAERKVRFVAWKLVYGYESNSFHERLEYLQLLGFEVVPMIVLGSNGYILETGIEELKTRAQKLNYPIDGLVVTYNDIKYGESLGMTGHHPKHSLAFKFYDEEELTVLRDIEWTIGKTGVLTPTAVFDTVEIDGTEVSRASLHNISICKQLNIGIGDEITVYKANQISPQVRESLTMSNTFVTPDRCPVCGEPTKIVKDNESEVLICTNRMCTGKKLMLFSHFTSKEAMNIEGLSEATLQKLIDLGWLQDYEDIYKLHAHAEELKKIGGFGSKSVNNLLTSIEKSKTTTLSRFLNAISIPLVGKSSAKTIAAICNGKLSEFCSRMESHFDWTTIDGFGEAISTSLKDYYQEHRDDIQRLAQEFIMDVAEQNQPVGVKNILNGASICVTGSLQFYANRSALEADIIAYGGIVASGVSKKTTYLLTNDTESSSSKNKKAKELNVPIISEIDFMKLINKNS